MEKSEEEYLLEACKRDIKEIFPHGLTPAVKDLFPVTKEGWATKEGGRFKSWKRRWFVLKDQVIYYFSNESSEKPKGLIPILPGNTSLGDASERFIPNCFKIRTQERDFYIRFETFQDKTEWMNEIKKILNKSSNPFAEKIKKRNISKAESDPTFKIKEQNSTSKAETPKPIPKDEPKASPNVSQSSLPIISNISKSSESFAISSPTPQNQQTTNSPNIIVVSPFPVNVQYNPATGQPIVYVYPYLQQGFAAKPVKIS